MDGHVEAHNKLKCIRFPRNCHYNILEASVSALRHCSVSAFTSAPRAASAGPPKPSETSFRPTASRMLFTPTLKSWSGHTSSGRMTSCVTSSDLTREPPTSIQPSSVSGLQRSAPAILSLPLPSASAGLVTAPSPSNQEKQRRHSESASLRYGKTFTSTVMEPIMARWCPSRVSRAT